MFLFSFFFFFFFNDTATTEIYTLSLHDALPIFPGTLDLLILKAVSLGPLHGYGVLLRIEQISQGALRRDRKSTRLNSSHGYISYAVFCLKKKKTTQTPLMLP